MNSKNIAIDDAVGKIRIPKYGFCNTPIRKIRLDDEQLRTVMNLYKGPKAVYALDPNNDNNRIRLDAKNFRQSEESLFGIVKPEPVVEQVIEEVKETDTMTLADLPTPPAAKEPEVIEEVVIPEETAPVIEEVVAPAEVVEPVIEETSPVAEPVAEQVEEDDFDDLKAETTATPESESVKEVPMKESEKKPQQNQNKPNNNYNHNNNGQKKKYTYNGGNNSHK